MLGKVVGGGWQEAVPALPKGTHGCTHGFGAEPCRCQIFMGDVTSGYIMPAGRRLYRKAK